LGLLRYVVHRKKHREDVKDERVDGWMSVVVRKRRGKSKADDGIVPLNRNREMSIWVWSGKTLRWKERCKMT
jgi:hypothetical protein